MSAHHKAVFLSYASQDVEAARKICEALRAAGIEVWFDQSELVGGDAWDAKIRRQIRECALFVPIVSAASQSRREGYFRLEWKLADDRTHLMAKGTPFVLPVCVDDTKDWEAIVPDAFMSVQWTRLPAGETPPRFCERVKKLLGAEGAPVSDRRQETEGPAPAGGRPALPLKAGLLARFRRSWFTVVAGATLALAVGTFFVLRKSASASAPSARAAGANPSAAPKSAAALTEAQQLVAKARGILDQGDELNRENHFLAEDLVKRAVSLDPAEPLAWALQARLSYLMTWHSTERSESRQDAMRRQAERARALAPESIEVQITSADVRLQLRQDLAGLERELLTLAVREPGNWRVQRSLGTTYRFLGRPDAAIEALKRARDLSGGLPIANADLVNALLRAHRHAEAEAVVARALATQTSGRLLTFDLMIRTQWRGDLVAARAALDKWPDWLLLEDRGAILAWRTWCWSGQFDQALAVTQRLQRDYLRDTFFTGPRAVLTARAHEGAGHLEAARADWDTVVQLANRELAIAPTDVPAAYWKAWALARLGDSAGAQAICAQMQQRNQLSVSQDRGAASNRTMAATYFGAPAAAPLWVTVGRPELALAELRAPPAVNDLFAVTRTMLELDPAFDSVRKDPVFKEALANAPAPAKVSAAPPAAGSDPKSAPTVKSVAVLAFTNVGGDTDNEIFSDGISEELINVLGRVAGLTVKGRSSSSFFKGSTATAQEKGEKLGATYLVDGSVRKQGNSVRIVARVSRAATDEVVWSSEPLVRDLKNVWAVQEEIAGLIAQALSLKLGVSSAAAKSDINPEAYRLYLEGRQAWRLRTTEGFEKAEASFNAALALEPNFAHAHAALADVWTNRGQDTRKVSRFEDRNSPEQTRIVAKVRHALSLDPLSPEAHASLGSILSCGWNFAEAERELRRSIALNPSYATAHQWLGRLLMSIGRMEEALASMKRAVELDPLSSRITDNYGLALFMAGKLRAASEAFGRALELQPGSTQALSMRSWVLAELGRSEEAATLVRRLPADDWTTAADQLVILARAGFRSEAESLLPTLHPRSVRDRARFLLALGRNEEAAAALDPANIASIDGADWLFMAMADPIRTDPRFAKFLATLGLTEAHARAQAWRAANPPAAVETKR